MTEQVYKATSATVAGTFAWALSAFQASLRGELICPNDRGYDAARRIWNGMIDKYPDLIVRCVDVVDVVTAVQFARLHHLSVAVRGGGHSVSGSSVCDGGMVIDLSRMKGVRIDPEKKTAWAQAGLTLSEFVQAMQAYGLATTTGTVESRGRVRASPLICSGRCAAEAATLAS